MSPVGSVGRLDSRSILIVDDEPLIAIDVARAFEDVGARVTISNSFRDAAALVENDGLSAAILDHQLGHDDSNRLCARLTERGIPFVTYTGHSHIEGPCSAGPHVSKPTDPQKLVRIVADLVAG